MWDLKLRLHCQRSTPRDVIYGVQTEPAHVLQSRHVPKFGNHATAKDSYLLPRPQNLWVEID